MAEAIRFVCGSCGHAMMAWSDSNPYYLDEAGVKQYAYHPNHELLERCIGNDVPHLCLSCGAEFVVDSEAPTPSCSECAASQIVDTCELEGKTCPFCKGGTFTRDQSFFCVS